MVDRYVAAFPERVLIDGEDRALSNGIALGDTRTGYGNFLETIIGSRILCYGG